jgi:predicted transposase YbfD/YdcC
MMSIEGAVVTIDAMGRQREIAARIIARKADYILAPRGNQGNLREDVETLADEQKIRDFTDFKITTHQTVDADHGRVETRKYTVIHNVDWLQAQHDWPALRGVIMAESQREFRDKVERETHYYITSTTLPAELLGPMIRNHWTIENSLHWVLDMTFRDDERRISTKNAPPISPP